LNNTYTKGITFSGPPKAVSNSYIDKIEEMKGMHKGETSNDSNNNMFLNKGVSHIDHMGKAKTEIHTGVVVFKAGVSVISNPRIVDNAWLNSFKVVKYLQREIFSDLFEIKMMSPQSIAGETRVLRKIRKVIFMES